MDRTAFLTSLIGRPWAPTRSCWHVAAEIELALFDRRLPSVEVPLDPPLRWAIETLRDHPEAANWQEVIPPHPGLISAPDGALVLLARVDRAAHVGVWLAPERLIIHCDQDHGTVAQDVASLRASGWGRIRFFEPI